MILEHLKSPELQNEVPYSLWSAFQFVLKSDLPPRKAASTSKIDSDTVYLLIQNSVKFTKNMQIFRF